MEVRFVTAVTRGFLFPARHDRGFAAQFSPENNRKKISGTQGRVCHEKIVLKSKQL